MSSSASRKRDKGKMERDSRRRKKNEVILPPVTKDDDKFRKLEELLLPGISDKTTLDLITTKMPWSIFSTLSSVSRAWQQALQNRLVHDIRVRTHSTETVVLFYHTQSRCHRINAIAVYSLIDKTFCNLPPIPEVDSGIPWNCQCISLAGKIYVLGGTNDTNIQLGSQEVYTLDLAGQWQWIQCAPMGEGRQLFGCGVLNGKIYVFGGNSLHTAVRGSEVYDPNVNAWSAISPMRCLWFNNNVAVLGEELLVYGGYHYRKGYPRFADGLRAYHPDTGKWRIRSKDFLPGGKIFGYGHERLFMAQGKFYCMSLSNILVYDIENKSWTERHTNSFAAITEPLLGANAVIAVDNELLAILWGETTDQTDFATFLVQSKGFGSEEKEIVWEKLPCSLSFKEFPPFMRP